MENPLCDLYRKRTLVSILCTFFALTLTYKRKYTRNNVSQRCTLCRAADLYSYSVRPALTPHDIASARIYMHGSVDTPRFPYFAPVLHFRYRRRGTYNKFGYARSGNTTNSTQRKNVRCEPPRM